LAAGNGIKSATARPLPGSSRKKLCTCQLLMPRRGILAPRPPFLSAAPPVSRLWHFLCPPRRPRPPGRAYFPAREFSLERFLPRTLAVTRMSGEEGETSTGIFTIRGAAQVPDGYRCILFRPIQTSRPDICRHFPLSTRPKVPSTDADEGSHEEDTLDKWPIRNSRAEFGCIPR